MSKRDSRSELADETRGSCRVGATAHHAMLARSGWALNGRRAHCFRPRSLAPTSLAALTCLLGGTASARAQVVDPPRQEEVELQRSSVVLGSGARALGMGGAFLARADDATAASWNPAGLSYLRRAEVSVVGFRSTRSTRGRDDAGETTSIDTFDGSALDFISLVHPLRLGSQFGAVQLSYQRLLPSEATAASRFRSRAPRGCSICPSRVGSTPSPWAPGFNCGSGCAWAPP